MADQNFEQQAKQLLGEFELTPKKELWEKVRKEIQPEKRKRRFVFWWLLPVIMAGASFIYYLAGDTKQKISDASIQPTSVTSKNENSINDKNTDNSNSNLNSTPVELASTDQNEETSSVTKVRSNTHNASNGSKPYNLSTTKTFTKEDAPTLSAKTTLNEQSKATTEIPSTSIVSKKNEESRASDSGDITELPKPLMKQQKEDAVVDSSATPTLIVKPSLKKNKWILGITTELGITNKAAGFSTDKAMDVPNSFPSTGSGSSSVGGSFRNTYSYNKGVSISIGGVARVALSKPFHFNSSLAYRYQSYAVKQEVYKDSFVGPNLFSTTKLYDSSAIVKLHSASLYTGISLQVLKLHNHKLLLNLGLDNSFLFAAKRSVNSLSQFTGGPFSNMDKSFTSLKGFQKWQPYLKTSVTIELERKKSLLQFSPYMQYGLRDIESTRVPRNRLTSYGVSASYFFKK